LLNHHIIRFIPAPIKVLLRTISYCFIFANLTSLLTFIQISRLNNKKGSKPRTARLQIRRLAGQTIIIRSHTTDARVVFSTFVRQFHVPPTNSVSTDASLIVDLGSNIGLTVADYGQIFPKAMIVGVEMDRDNAALCTINTEHLKSRVHIAHAAVWTEDGYIQYGKIRGYEDGLSIIRNNQLQPIETVCVTSLSINTLFNTTLKNSSFIDFMKMDIEGAEKAVLREHTEWASRVQCIMVECHDEYKKQHCMKDLENLGFKARYDTSHSACVIGLRTTT